MSKIVFSPPGPETPGYLRRLRAALDYRKSLQVDPSPETIDALVEFLLPYVTEPAERDPAREALWDATQTQFMELLGAITGGGDENPTG